MSSVRRLPWWRREAPRIWSESKRVERLGSLESDCNPHVVEHVGGVVGASVEPEADADPGVLYVGVAHDARREPHVAERVVGHGGLEADEGGDVGVARVDEVGRVKVAAERERATILEHLELVRRHVGDVLEHMEVKLIPNERAASVALVTWVWKNGTGAVAT